MKRFGILISLMFAGSLVLAAPVLAAAPSNDLFGGATAVSLGFSQSLDTTEATTDADDALANADCGAPATDASVWYTLTGADNGVVVDVSSSDYSAGVIVVTGDPVSGFFLETCGPGAVAFFAASGTTYSILAFDDQEDGNPDNGGALAINVAEIPPPPTVDVTVDPVGHFNKDGTATITGTVTCSGAADFSFIEVSARQTVGRIFINGFGSTDFVCDGETHAWSADVFPDNGVFKGGRTATVTVATSCGVFDCGSDFEETTVRLRK
jgi:hypothetical protein